MNKLHLKLLYVFIVIAIVLSGPKVFAKDIVLNNIEFMSGSTGSEIVLNASAKTNVKTKIISNDTVIINLKNTVASENIHTAYTHTNNIKHILLKPQNNDLQVEIAGNDIANSKIFLNNKQIKTAPANPLWKISLIMLGLIMTAIIAKIKMSKKTKYSVRIPNSKEMMEDKILKVAFERRTGLIAQGTGIKRVEKAKTISQYNVRKVNFENEYTQELKVKI